MFRAFQSGRTALLRASSSSSQRDASYNVILTAALAASVTILATSTSTALCEPDLQEEERNFQQTLKHHKSQLEYYSERWNWHNAGSRLPTVSWPTNIPDEPMYNSLSADFKFCQKDLESDSSSSGTSTSKYCQDIQFRIGSYMLLQQDLETQKRGLALLQNLAESNHPGK